MTDICFYFQVHQPFRLKKYSVFDIGKPDYFDNVKNHKITRKVAEKCYLPTNKLLLNLLNNHDNFKISYSITGTAIDQFEKYAPEVLDSFKDLAKTGKVEFLSETYHHSLSFLFNKEEFSSQLELHKLKIKQLFNQKPTIFRNTELIYNNELAKYIEKLGYKGIIAEGADHILDWKSPNYVYNAKDSKIKLLLKNYKLSDDIAFRFSNQNWKGWPLTAKKYVDWISPIQGDSINLFMDYETFGEHQWESTGIFKFLEQLPKELEKKNIGFKLPSELVNHQAKDEIDIPNTISWADIERDCSAWLGNNIQNDAITKLYELRQKVMCSGNPNLIETWRRLSTSDHFYYMCTKWFNDGDVHKYFNPYDSPYDAYIAFMNVLNDLSMRLTKNQEWVKLR